MTHLKLVADLVAAAITNGDRYPQFLLHKQCAPFATGTSYRPGGARRYLRWQFNSRRIYVFCARQYPTTYVHGLIVIKTLLFYLDLIISSDVILCISCMHDFPVCLFNPAFRGCQDPING